MNKFLFVIILFFVFGSYFFVNAEAIKSKAKAKNSTKEDISAAKEKEAPIGLFLKDVSLENFSKEFGTTDCAEKYQIAQIASYARTCKNIKYLQIN